MPENAPLVVMDDESSNVIILHDFPSEPHHNMPDGLLTEKPSEECTSELPSFDIPKRFSPVHFRRISTSDSFFLFRRQVTDRKLFRPRRLLNRHLENHIHPGLEGSSAYPIVGAQVSGAAECI